MLFKLSPLTIKWLPVSNSNRTDLTLLKEVLRSIGTPNAFLWFVDQARFGYVNRKKGLISLLSPMHAHEVHGRQRRYRPPKTTCDKGGVANSSLSATSIGLISQPNPFGFGQKIKTRSFTHNPDIESAQLGS